MKRARSRYRARRATPGGSLPPGAGSDPAVVPAEDLGQIVRAGTETGRLGGPRARRRPRPARARPRARSPRPRARHADGARGRGSRAGRGNGSRDCRTAAPGRWTLPGGSVEPPADGQPLDGEALRRDAARELAEELGVRTSDGELRLFAVTRGHRVGAPRPTTSPRSVGSSTVTNTDPGTSPAVRRTRRALNRYESRAQRATSTPGAGTPIPGLATSGPSNVVGLRAFVPAHSRSTSPCSHGVRAGGGCSTKLIRRTSRNSTGRARRWSLPEVVTEYLLRLAEPPAHRPPGAGGVAPAAAP
ncbi:NUDIX hydrolase [Streptomyces sp. NPDC056517]|uniref:NUDIX hydrolase n=1 Tax=Streptomyces sp. NPDC056517 TaxID=3345848 RepID=UPI0036BC88A6